MKLDPKTTALLTLDLQHGIIGMFPAASAAVAPAAKAVAFARKNNIRVIHVGLGFSPGHPEIPDNSRFARVKLADLFVKGTKSAEFDDSLTQPGDLVVYKQRVGGF